MSRLSLSAEEDHFLLKGEITFATVASTLKHSLPLFKSVTTLQVDLKGVRRVDSSALALLLEWGRMMQQRQGTFRFFNTPHALQRLARIGGVDALLSLE